MLGTKYEPLTGNLIAPTFNLDLSNHLVRTYLSDSRVSGPLVTIAADFKPDQKNEELTLNLYKSDKYASVQSMEPMKTLEINCQNISENIIPFKLSFIEEKQGEIAMRLGLGWRAITVKSKTSKEKVFMVNGRSINDFRIDKKVVGTKAEYDIGFKITPLGN
jgi:hypothetical protein